MMSLFAKPTALDTAAPGIVTSQSSIDVRWRQDADPIHFQRLLTLGEMATSLAHELSQPLTAVATCLQILTKILEHRTPSREELAPMLAGATQATAHAASLVRNMRALAKPAANKHVPLDLQDVLLEAISLTAPHLKLHNVGLICNIPEQLPPVQGDRLQLVQIVLNLLLNACEAHRGMPGNGEVTLTVQGLPDQVLVTVKDQGKGLTSEQAARVFEPFFTTKEGGLGMGLALVRTLVETHGGRVWAEPGECGGAIFCFTLPIVLL